MNVLMVGDVYGEPGRAAAVQARPPAAPGARHRPVRRQRRERRRRLRRHAADVPTVPRGGRRRDDVGQPHLGQAGDRRVHHEGEPPPAPGQLPGGHARRGLRHVKAGPHRVAVLNLMGRVFMTPIDCPFRKADEIMPELRKETPIILVDMHARPPRESHGHGLVSRRAGERGRRHAPPRADRRRARAARAAPPTSPTSASPDRRTASSAWTASRSSSGSSPRCRSASRRPRARPRSTAWSSSSIPRPAAPPTSGASAFRRERPSR